MTEIPSGFNQRQAPPPLPDTPVPQRPDMSEAAQAMGVDVDVLSAGGLNPLSRPEGGQSTPGGPLARVLAGRLADEAEARPVEL